MDELTVHDLLAILRRQKKAFFVTVALLFTITVIAALCWSNYRSMAQVEIEQSSVSPNVMTTTGSPGDSQLAITDQRISKVEQKVTSTDSLSEIITKMNLYPNARKNNSVAAVTNIMRNKIKLDFVNSTVSNPAAAQKETAEQLSAIAFTLSFDYSDAHIAQQVNEELVKRFIDEDIKLRRTYAQETSAFLAEQIKMLEKSMAEQDKKMADFRAAHGDSGPAALAFNQQATVTTALSVQSIESQLASNEGTQGSLRAQLATVDPYSRVIADGQVLTTPAIQLKALEAQYSTLSGRYGPDHPDVIKARSQIDSLRAQVNGGGGGHRDNTAQLKAQINDVKTHLAAAKSTGGNDNPDVKILERKYRSLQDQLQNASYSGGSDNIKRDADNPAYLQLTSQLMAANEQHKSLAAQRDALISQQAKYQKAVAENPDAEQQMATLSRDYDNSQLRYRELKEKKMQADMNQQLEEGGKGQRLIVTYPADLPRHTHPSRLLLLAAGLTLSVMGGLISVIIAESMRQSIHGPNQLTMLMGRAPLVIIPHITSENEIMRIQQLRPYKIIAVVICLLIGAALFLTILAPTASLNSLSPSSGSSSRFAMPGSQ